MKQVLPLAIEGGMSQSGSFVLMLCELDGNRQIPIVIGAAEAQAILLAKEAVETRRPLTHETMVKVMHQFGLTLKRVTIDRVVDGIFYATLHISDGFNIQQTDSRTTDAVTLALLSEAPIYVDDKVLDECAVRMSDTENHEPTIDELEAALRLCEETEDYERAAEIQQQIEKLKK